MELIAITARLQGYKVSTQESTALLYTSNEQLEFEIKNTTSFTLAPQNEMLMYKSNKIYVKPKREKPQDTDERNEKSK